MYDLKSDNENKTPNKFENIEAAELINLSTYFLGQQS